MFYIFLFYIKWIIYDDDDDYDKRWRRGDDDDDDDERHETIWHEFTQTE